MWSEVDSSMTLQALLGPRDRDNRFLSRFLKKKQIIHPALLRGRERCTYPLPKQFPLSLGRPSRGLLLLCLPPVDGGQDGRGGLPTPSSTAPLLEAAADVVREQGWIQGAALGDEQAGRCNRRTGGGSSCPPRQEVLDRLSLLLCSWELLGQVISCVAEEAIWDTGTLRNRLCQRPYVNQTQPEGALLDQKCGHRTTQRPCHNLRRSWREVRCGTELFSELPDRNHPRACPSVLLA